ncbi:hypothetical protein FB451DRAFT_1032641, partial [Mycena latifolia]
WPIPSDVAIDHCAEWSNVGELDADEEFPYSADTSFELPVAANTLFLLSRHLGRGFLVGGRVIFLQSEDVSDTVNVDVTAQFWHQEHLDATKACLLAHDGDKSGVGLFWEADHPRDRKRHNALRIYVTVTFPQTDDGALLAINNLSTDLQIFTQIFGDVSSVAFKTLELKSSLGGVFSESLVAEHADVHTSMGAIEGTFNASHGLVLRTSNAPIFVDVNLAHTDANKPARLLMTTSNGYINGNISLLSSGDAPAAFDVIARTANAPLSLSVAAPPAANITLRATTAIGAASVALPASYEGSFAASTSLSSVTVNIDENAEDPSGQGRERRVDWDANNRGHAKGRVGWDEEGMGRGSVSVRTSMAPVTLKF